MDPPVPEPPNHVGSFQAILDVAADNLERLDEPVRENISTTTDDREEMQIRSSAQRLIDYMRRSGAALLRLVIYVHPTCDDIQLDWINHDPSSDLNLDDLPKDLDTLRQSTFPVNYIVHIKSLCEKRGSTLPRDRAPLHDLSMIRFLRNVAALVISPMVDLRSFSGVPTSITSLLATHQTQIRSYRFLTEIPRMMCIRMDHSSFPSRTIVLERMTNLRALSLQGVVTFSSLSNVPTDKLTHLNIRGTSVTTLRAHRFPCLQKLVLDAGQTEMVGKDVRLPSILCIEIFGAISPMTERRLTAAYGPILFIKPQ